MQLASITSNHSAAMLLLGAVNVFVPDIPCSGEVRVKQQQSAGDIHQG